MRKNKFFSILVVVTIFAMALTSCNLLNYFGEDQAEDFSQIETMAAATISAMITQSAYETLVAQLTQVVQPTAQPLATSTLIPTSTPIATFTPMPPPVTPVPPTATPIPIPCNGASYLADVTIPDWSTLNAGENFVKTWQVKNVGTCNWTTDYKIFFSSGTQMDASSAVAFPKTVKPGETVNLSVSMVAPSNTGSYTGSWMLKSGDGKIFGVGRTYDVPLTVNIKIEKLPDPKDPDTVYDFVKNYCSASWRTNGGDIGCPSGKIDTSKGSITRSYTPVIAGGYKDDEGGIYTVPAQGGDGFILGKFPKITIKDGDRFRALLICADGAKNCSVTYELQYTEVGGSSGGTLGSWDVTYNDSESVDVDLSSLKGKTVQLLLKVISKGDSTDDVAIWLAPRVTNP